MRRSIGWWAVALAGLGGAAAGCGVNEDGSCRDDMTCSPEGRDADGGTDAAGEAGGDGVAPAASGRPTR